MIARLLFYAAEAAGLACITLASLMLVGQGLRRFGSPLRTRHGRVLFWAWLAFLVIGIVFGETVGPEFVLPYQFCFWLAVSSALFWLISFAKRRAPEAGSQRKPQATSGGRAE